jgi:hypothetical protein
MKYGKKLKLEDAHVTPRNIQELQVSKLGDAPRHPFFIGKNQVIFQYTIFLLLCILSVFLGVSLLSLSVFFCFVFCNKWLVLWICQMGIPMTWSYTGKPGWPMEVVWRIANRAA